MKYSNDCKLMNMVTIKQSVVIIVFLMTVLGFTKTVYAAEDFIRALQSGQVSGDIRYRLEKAGQQEKRDATASTVRTRLSYGSASYRDLYVAIEFEGVFSVFKKEYNSGLNDNLEYATILDPTVIDANQRYIAYQGIPKTSIFYGRQRIVFNNGRFVGDDGWRQNEQSFDSLTINSTLIPFVELTYAHIYQRVGVLSRVEQMKTNLLDISYHGFKNHVITAYGYFFNLTQRPLDSQQTFGSRMTGEYDLQRGSFLVYAIEYARQSSYKGSPEYIKSDYVNADLGINIGKFKARVGFEQLSGDDKWGFSTPLASKHSFNGRTNQFIETPLSGLRDLSFSLESSFAGMTFQAGFHDFVAYVDNRYLGNEWYITALKTIDNDSELMLGYASYSDDDESDGIGNEGSRLWFQYQIDI